MSVIVKGMQMPESCNDCPFLKFSKLEEVFYCIFTKRGFWTNAEKRERLKQRADNCPLVELPKHRGK